MYERVGTYEGALGALVDAGAKGIPLVPTMPLRYNTSDSVLTEKIYGPLLGDVFPGFWIKCFLSVIWPAGSIHPHVDQDAKGRDRLHLVLQTNEEAYCIHDGCLQQLEAGGIYRMDPTKLHASINWGEQPRINFVVDRAKGEH